MNGADGLGVRLKKEKKGREGGEREYEGVQGREEVEEDSRALLASIRLCDMRMVRSICIV